MQQVGTTSGETPITEADILTHVVAPGQSGMSPELAASLLQLRFDETAEHRINTLLERNSEGLLTDSESAELEKFMRVGLLIDLVQARARASLDENPAPRQ